MIAIVSDSQAAVQSVRNLSKGAPPRSQIERRIKEALRQDTRDVGILWVSGHIGIERNEKADARAEYESFLASVFGKEPSGTGNIELSFSNQR